mmetsp:Transcript_20422/g.63484  ORF Transcript_20422/g.63484 Transcript_20422/m.63484 type:complete len:356 (-) Transcript_20422:496-1563(-)
MLLEMGPGSAAIPRRGGVEFVVAAVVWAALWRRFRRCRHHPRQAGGRKHHGDRGGIGVFVVTGLGKRLHAVGNGVLVEPREKPLLLTLEGLVEFLRTALRRLFELEVGDALPFLDLRRRPPGARVHLLRPRRPERLDAVRDTVLLQVCHVPFAPARLGFLGGLSLGFDLRVRFADRAWCRDPRQPRWRCLVVFRWGVGSFTDGRRVVHRAAVVGRAARGRRPRWRGRSTTLLRRGDRLHGATTVIGRIGVRRVVRRSVRLRFAGFIVVRIGQPCRRFRRPPRRRIFRRLGHSACGRVFAVGYGRCLILLRGRRLQRKRNAGAHGLGLSRRGFSRRGFSRVGLSRRRCFAGIRDGG